MSPTAPDTTQAPAAEPTPAQTAPAQAQESARTQPIEPASPRPFSLGRALGLTQADGRTPASKAAEPDQQPSQEPAPKDGEPSAPSESKPSDAPKPDPEKPQAEDGSRRERKEHANVARIRELEAEIASIKSATPADPDTLIAEAVERARAEERERIQREQSEAEQRRQQEAVAATQRETIERYERLRDLPSHAMSAEDWEWVEERRDRFEKFPEVQQELRALERTRADRAIESERAALYAELTGKQDEFWRGVHADLDGAKSLPNVDVEAVRTAPTFADRDRLLHAAGAAWKEAEYAPKLAALEAELTKRDERIARLEDDIHDLGLVGPRGLGSARAPVTGGRSPSTEVGPPAFDPDRGWRSNLAAALAGSSNGRR